MNNIDILKVLGLIDEIENTQSEIESAFNALQTEYKSEIVSKYDFYSREPSKPVYVEPDLDSVWFRRGALKKEAEKNYARKLQRYKELLKDYEIRKAGDPEHMLPAELKNKEKRYQSVFSYLSDKYHSLTSEKKEALDVLEVPNRYRDNIEAIRFFKEALEAKWTSQLEGRDGAYLLYEDRVFREKLLSSLRIVSKNIKDETRRIVAELKQIVDSQRDIQTSVERTAVNTFITGLEHDLKVIKERS